MTSILEWLKRLFGKKLFNLEWLRSLFRRSLKFPVSFPTTGWEIIPADDKIEEEQMPDVDKVNEYCNFAIGDILLSRYQVVGKLGWGTASTVWLVRDLEMDGYMALKVFSLCALGVEEADFYNLIGRRSQHHLGSGQRLDKLSIQLTIYQMLLALDYLHTECELIHADIKGDNIFQEIGDETRLDRYVQAEIANPTPRKIVFGHPLYRSRPLESASQLGKIQIGDLGSVQHGDYPREGQFIQPGFYRAPEVMLEKEWNYPVDIWNLAVWAWRAFEGKELFTCKKTGGPDDSISIHLAQITGLLGPPPPDFIEPDTVSAKYFDKDGNWILEDCEVQPSSFEDLEKHLQGEDKEMFLDLMKGMITWRPEDRKTPRELIEHPWLQGIFWPPGVYKPTE
ncbi:unnamed protein product [Penicillium glandicola]